MGKRRLIVKEFNSATEFLEWATSAPCQWKGELESREKGNSKWAGTKTYEEAYDLALYGWEEGLKRLAKEFRKAQRIITPPTTRQHTFDFAGHRPHPARAAAGEPLSMIRESQADIKPKPIINITTNFSYNANIFASKIMKWGAAICS